MRTLPKYLTQDELHRFFATIKSPRDRALFGVIYHYGLRVDEATALTVEDLDLKNHRLRIRRLKNGPGGEKPLWRHTAKLLRAYMRVRKDAGPYLLTDRAHVPSLCTPDNVFYDGYSRENILVPPPHHHRNLPQPFT